MASLTRTNLGGEAGPLAAERSAVASLVLEQLFSEFGNDLVLRRALFQRGGRLPHEERNDCHVDHYQRAAKPRNGANATRMRRGRKSTSLLILASREVTLTPLAHKAVAGRSIPGSDNI